MRRKRSTGAVNSKKKTIDGITFASSLEAYTYAKLKEAGIDFEYEGRTFEVLPAFRYEAEYLHSTSKKKEMSDKTGKLVRAVTYKPDFVGEGWVIECKGFVPSNHSFPLRLKMFLSSLQGQNMRVYIPKNQSQVNEVIKILSNE
jgi:hypothetical protein